VERALEFRFNRVHPSGRTLLIGALTEVKPSIRGRFEAGA
jgi:hypothetical protein